MSITLLDGVVKKNRARLIPFMLALYVLAFLDRSNIGFAKETYQIDTGLSNEAYALGAGIFFVVYAFLGVPANLLMRKFGARTWIGTTTLLWGFLSAAMAWADSEAKFLIIRTLLGAAEAGFFPGMIYLTCIYRIRAAGKAAGFLAVDPAMAQKCLAWGANFVAVGVDTMLYTEALDSRLAMFKSVQSVSTAKRSY